MFWADNLAIELKKRGKALEWVDDMKTPSGRVHVGALRGVVVHDLAYKALLGSGANAKYTYVFENHDPMDDIPSYLPRGQYEQYLGMPLFKIPSPEPAFKDYAEFFALEFQKVFNEIGCRPEIVWTKDLYTSGKMNDGIKKVLDKADIVRGIYKELYKKEIPSDWYPFQVYCEQCGKVSTTRVFNWDGENVYYRCVVDAVKWTRGCGHESKTSPFSDENGMKGKMPWKVEWAVKWMAIGVTVEGAGKDHMSKGGSHDLASLVCKRVLDYPVPYPVPYEWFLIGGRKMSSSKGVGSSAKDALEILPPQLLRFLMVKTNINQAINFDPAGHDIIPKLFDDYQEYASHFFEKKQDDYARVFELSQIGEVQKPPNVKFSTLAQWIQMPNMSQKIKDEGAEAWAKYARVWLEKYAPESEKFLVQKEVPDAAKGLNPEQKAYLSKLSEKLDETADPEKLQMILYNLSKEVGLSPKDAFSAIYLSLIGKSSGPKASHLLASLDKEFVKTRFNTDLEHATGVLQDEIKVSAINKPEIFAINNILKNKYPSISVGIAIIKNVTIQEKNEELEKEKLEVLKMFDGLTTEKLGEEAAIKSYRRIYKETGVDWHSRRPSPEALLRRIALNKGLYSVNTCVDAYNLAVMKNRVSVGAFDLDKISFPTELRLAKEGEEILLLGDDAPTKYKEGEIAYFDQSGGYNMDFNYRDAQRTAVSTLTKNIFINVDGVYDIKPQLVEKVLRETCDLILKYNGGVVDSFGVVV